MTGTDVMRLAVNGTLAAAIVAEPVASFDLVDHLVDAHCIRLQAERARVERNIKTKQE